MSKAITNILGGLFGERKNGEWMASKGNVAFWILLGHCLYNWQMGVSVPELEVYSMWGLIGYSVFKRLKAAQDKVETK